MRMDMHDEAKTLFTILLMNLKLTESLCGQPGCCNVMNGIFRRFIPVLRAYKYIGKWVCTSNTTIFINIAVFDVHTHLPIYL